MWNDRYRGDPCSVWGRACLDPGTLLVASLASTAIGAAISATGTIAGGMAAKKSAAFQATQLQDNAADAFASGQRKAFDSNERARLAISTARADAAGNGTNAAVGSPVNIQSALAARGSYNAAMDMFNGASTATGLRNQAAGVKFSGDQAEDASFLSAAGTLAGSAGSMLKTAGQYQYPQVSQSS